MFDYVSNISVQVNICVLNGIIPRIIEENCIRRLRFYNTCVQAYENAKGKNKKHRFFHSFCLYNLDLRMSLDSDLDSR